MDRKTTERRRRGLIAYFHLLGAGRYLEGEPRAQLEEAIVHVCDSVAEAAGAGTPIQFKLHGPSLVLLLEMDHSPAPGPVELAQWAAFLRGANWTLRHLFNHGYPARCTVHFGEIAEADPGSAGDLVLEAYRLAREQDWCGGIVAEAAYERLWDLLEHVDPPGGGGFDESLVSYRVPLKDGGRDRMALRWSREDAQRIFVPLGSSIRETVVRTFARHAKALDPGAMQKAANTEAFLWYCRENSAKRPDLAHGGQPGTRILRSDAA